MPQQHRSTNDTEGCPLSWGTAFSVGPREVLMNLSQMTHNVTDALKRMTDRLTHRRDTQLPKPSTKGEALYSNTRGKWDDVT